MPLILLTARIRAGRDSRRRTGLWAVGGASATVVLVLALLSGSLSWVTVSEHDFDQDVRLAGNFEIPQPPPVPASTRDHGRPLDAATVGAALDQVPGLLPPAAKAIELPESSDTIVNPASCDEALHRFREGEKALGRSADLQRGYEFPVEGIAAAVNIFVGVSSYDVPWNDLSGGDEVARECASYRLPSAPYDGGYVDVSLRNEHLPPTGYQALRKTTAMTGQVDGRSISLAGRQRLALVGHNVVSVEVFWWHGKTAPPQDTVDRLDRLVADAVDRIVAEL